jgi:hypothetical protein
VDRTRDGDGSVDATSSGPSATWVYRTAGTWTARVTATAADGRSATRTGTIVVTTAR